jgi:hypothetical protein
VASKRLKFSVPGEFNAVQDPLLFVQIKQVEFRCGPRDRNTLAINQPDSIARMGSKTLGKDLEHFDRLEGSIDDKEP